MDAFITCEHISYTIRKGACLRVGRAIDCDIRLFKDQRVSRQHCLISNDEDVVTVVDVGSKHGTTVNGNLVTSHPTTLKEGDLLQIGETSLIFHQYSGDGPDEDTKSWPLRGT